MMLVLGRTQKAQKYGARVDYLAMASPDFRRASGTPAHHSGKGKTEPFLHGCFQNLDLCGDTLNLSRIPSIPFIPVKNAFKTGMKGMNGMLLMALRAATYSSPSLLCDSTPVAFAAHRRGVCDFLPNSRTWL